MVVPKQLWSGPIPGLLQGIANEILDSRQPLLRGDVIGPRGPLVSGSDITSLYAAIPVYFPDSFASCRVGDTSIAIVWLIPISSREAAFVRENGWPAFEELLVQIDPDLTNPFRPSIV
jgi:hypothetical protein